MKRLMLCISVLYSLNADAMELTVGNDGNRYISVPIIATITIPKQDEAKEEKSAFNVMLSYMVDNCLLCRAITDEDAEKTQKISSYVAGIKEIGFIDAFEMRYIYDVAFALQRMSKCLGNKCSELAVELVNYALYNNCIDDEFDGFLKEEGTNISGLFNS